MSKNLLRQFEIGLVVTALIFTLLCAATIFSRIMTRQYSVDNVFISGHNLGGMHYTELIDFLDQKYSDYLKTTVFLEFRGQKYLSTLEKLGVQFDSYGTVEKVYTYSYGDNILQHLVRRLSSLFEPTTLVPNYYIDREKMQQSISDQIPEILSARNASIVIDDQEGIRISAHHDGMSTNFDQVYAQVDDAVASLEIPDLVLPERKIYANYTEDQASEDAKIVQTLLGQRIQINGRTIKIPADWYEVRNQKIIFNRQAISKYLQDSFGDLQRDPLDATITRADSNSPYATVNGLRKDGQSIDLNHSAEAIVQAIRDETFKASLTLTAVPAKFVNRSGLNLGKLDLLATGRSNFAGSPWGRSFNIRKGMDEKVNNILLAPGANYSFNQHLGEVTESQGWQDALAIFGGDELKPVAGGGLCQVSTTLYRGILNAGLEVLEASNHSLYVHYYKAYGDGLDAAIYPGSKDLQFRNNTDNYILVQAYTEGNDAIVNVYGTSDGRRVEMVGPIYQYDVPEAYLEQIKPKANQIIWIQKIISSAGVVEENTLVSSYKTAVR